MIIMSTYEELQIIISVALLIVAILTYANKK
ncbi:putative holin-like toxin [Fusicatenibacter saccharivorans]